MRCRTGYFLSTLFALSILGCSSGTTDTPFMEVGSQNPDDATTDLYDAGADADVPTIPTGDTVILDGSSPGDVDCLPACGTNQCGPDGCEGKCGECSPLHQCTQGQCVALPSCQSDEDCPDEETCDTEQGICISCTPSCSDKACGTDGCGGVCGQCEGEMLCVDGQCKPAPPCAFPGECHPLVCDENTGKCAPCISDEQCPDMTVCDEDSGNCLACASDADCPDLEECIMYVCVPLPTCQSDEDCPADKQCDQVTGQCSVCTPNCEGKDCGSDGCKGTCGQCLEGFACEAGQCLCVPDCADKVCGEDGCAGLCGECGDNGQCVAGQCVAGWTDPQSGLVWQNPPAPNMYTQYDGEDYCNGLVWGGSDQWYLPSIDQLWSITAGQSSSGCPWKEGLTGPCGWYWSSTFHEGSNDDWESLNFADHDQDGQDNDNLMHVRCVRNGP